MQSIADALAWYIALQVIGLAAWPMVARAFPVLDDGGWGVARAAGLLLVSWIVWVSGMLLPVPYFRVTIVLAVAVVAAAAWVLLPRLAGDVRRPGEWLRRRWRAVLALEVLFAAAYAFFSLLRSYDPAIAGTEKPMDMAFFNGFVAADHLPTQDTWLSGYGVPYYYFGYFVFATVAKLTAIPASVGYNLAAASVPSLAVVALASVAWNVARAGHLPSRWAAVAAILAPTLAIFSGNLRAFFELQVARGLISREAGHVLSIKQFAEGVTAGTWPPSDGGWWFRSSRIIPNLAPDGINEFPFFSAFLSDLHPHFMALPFEVLAFTAIAATVLSRGQTLRSPLGQALSALTLGSFVALNTWDVAPFWLLYVLAAGVAVATMPPSGSPLPLGEGRVRASPVLQFTAARHAVLQRIGLVLAAPVAGLVLFSPYFVGYGGPPLGLGIVQERTPLGSLLVLFGPHLALLLVLGIWARWCAATRIGWVTAGLGALGGIFLTALGQPTLGLLVALLALLLPWPGLIGRMRPAAVVAIGIGAFAVAILLGVELIFLRDTFGTRMNTVFKFHYNAWLLASLAGSLAVAAACSQWRGLPRWLAGSLAVIAVATGLVYPLTVAQTRFANPPPAGPTLDGTAFLPPDEAAAIDWLLQQSQNGRPVIAEAVAGQYSRGARMATYSGGSAVLGWPGHELQWRGPLPELSRRESDLLRLYSTADAETVAEILTTYAVDYVVVGDLERQVYGPAVGARFQPLLPLAFRAGRVAIYSAESE